MVLIGGEVDVEDVVSSLIVGKGVVGDGEFVVLVVPSPPCDDVGVSVADDVVDVVGCGVFIGRGSVGVISAD